MSLRSRPLRLVVLLLAGLWSCDFATDVELLEVEATGVLAGQAFLDLNGNGSRDGGDEPLGVATVELTAPGSGEVVLDATTDTLGVFVLTAVPLGTYEVGLASSVLGDSLTTLGTVTTVTVELGDTAIFNVGASYPTLSLEEVRAAASGRRVFTHGVTLNARVPSTDGTVHLLDTTTVTYLRTTGVTTPAGSILIGDSVRFLGRTGTDNGQPVLQNVTPYVLQRGLAIPPPPEATTAEAAAAEGGIDAALVRIRAAEISDTSTAANGDFHYWADDGTGPIEVVYKWFRNISSSSIRPDTIVRVRELTGLLTPHDDGTGTVRWRILPRGGSEVLLEIKGADIAVTTAYDTAQASVGDTVEVMVTVSNEAAGFGTTHVTATGVSITDQLPAQLTFLSATATAGGYDDATGVWSVGDLAPLAADTLRISAEVTGGPGTATNTATSDGLVYEADTRSGNNSDSADLPIS